MAARETDMMEDEILETECIRKSTPISTITIHTYILQSILNHIHERFTSQNISISSKTQNLFNIHYLQCCLGGHFCLHVTSGKSEVSGWACPAAGLLRTRLRLTDDVTALSQWANFCHAKTGQAFCLESDLSLWHAKTRHMFSAIIFANSTRSSLPSW